ncbi:MAG TPA: DUF4129 domain-containing protein [Thermoanaerobaculia bacterium]|nr:DUF4129 domain-containing protein [Thermoanaerobaculia bacterium]
MSHPAVPLPGWQPLVRRALPVAAAVFALTGWPPAAAAQADAEAEGTRELAARILRDAAYQTELPTGEAAGAGEAGRPGDRRLGLPAPRGVGFLAELLLWLLIGAAVVVAVLWLVRAVGTTGPGAGGREPEGGAEGPEAASGRPRPPGLARVEALAAAGRHAEAVHALLLLALARIDRRRGRPFPESATAREVLGAAELPAAARAGLAELVTAVERSLFGRLALRAEDWGRCRTAYAAVEEAL